MVYYKGSRLVAGYNRQRESEVHKMISFINSFLSYIVLMVIIIVVAGVGFGIGLALRKRKNSQAAVSQNSEE